MKHLFIPYELALLAKEKGYNEQDFAYYRLSFEEEKEPFKAVELGWFKEYYDNHNFRLSLSKSAINPICTAPLYQQIIDWFREKHSLALVMNWSGRNGHGEFNYWHCQIHHAVYGLKIHINKTHYYTYEEIDGRKVGGQMVPEFENFSYYECLNKAIEEAFKLI